MNNNFKIVEIRDRATFIPALAWKVQPESALQKVLFKSIGYYQPCIMLMSIQAPNHSARYSDDWGKHGRTMGTAHKWIEENFDNIVDCQVIDVEYILGEVEKPCLSYREEEINKAFEGCESEEEKSNLSNYMLLLGSITNSEYLTKYGYSQCWICKERRSDKFISVKVHDVSLEQGFDQEGNSLINVKYCNDREVCKGDAHIKKLWVRI